MAVRNSDGYRGAKAVEPVLSTFCSMINGFRINRVSDLSGPCFCPVCPFVPSLWMSDPDQALLLTKGIFCCLE